MKTSTTALAALLVAAIGTTAIVPITSAQESAAPAPQEIAPPPAAQEAPATVEDARFMPDRMRMGGHGFGPWLDLVCSPKGAEDLEVALVRLDHRLDLTSTQTPLYDKFKATALTAQTSFADKCESARPAKDATAKPDLLDRIKSGIEVQTARLEALNTVLPDFEAFYNSLTDKQKEELLPPRMDRQMMMRDFRDNAPGRFLRQPAPGRY